MVVEMGVHGIEVLAVNPWLTPVLPLKRFCPFNHQTGQFPAVGRKLPLADEQGGQVGDGLTQGIGGAHGPAR